jgi:hypothetical protein
MKGLLVFALVASIGHASTALAGESILTSGARHVQQMTAGEALASTAPDAPRTVGAVKTVATPVSTSAFQTEGTTLSRSGMGKGKKMLIYIAIGVGFAASAWTIDHHVLNVTPSSLGTRQD